MLQVVGCRIHRRVGYHFQFRQISEQAQLDISHRQDVAHGCGAVPLVIEADREVEMIQRSDNVKALSLDFRLNATAACADTAAGRALTC